jgi:flagellar biosynthesis protein FliP
MLQWIRKHRKALAGISVGAGAFFAAISFITYKVMAAEETTASGNNLINIGISTSDGNDMASVLQMLLVLTVISLAPSILIMLTSFTRIVIVLHFTRAALGTQTVPPNQVIIGLSLFFTFLGTFAILKKGAANTKDASLINIKTNNSNCSNANVKFITHYPAIIYTDQSFPKASA